jgi:hypothetical protein
MEAESVTITYWVQMELESKDYLKAIGVNHFLITRIVAIRKLMLSTRLSFRSEMKQGSAFSVFLLPHARRVCIGNTLPC